MISQDSSNAQKDKGEHVYEILQWKGRERKNNRKPTWSVGKKNPDTTRSGTLFYILFNHSSGTTLSKQGMVPNRFFVCIEQPEKIPTGQLRLLLSLHHSVTKIMQA